MEKTFQMKKNIYQDSAKYYDLLVNKKEIKKEVAFLANLLKKYRVKTLLEIGCGTGLYLIPLGKKGFEVEGLDLSENMLKEAKKKDPELKLYKRNMADFKLGKKYGLVLCLSSTLLLLKNFKQIKKAIENFIDHLTPKGILLLDLPNHKVEIREKNNIKEHERHKILGGIANFTFLSTKKQNKWQERWWGEIVRKSKVERFEDLWEEFIYSPEKLERFFKKKNLKILKLYGSLKGNKFNKNKSYRRVYILQITK